MGPSHVRHVSLWAPAMCAMSACEIQIASALQFSLGKAQEHRVLFKMTPVKRSVRLQATLKYLVCDLTHILARHHS